MGRIPSSNRSIGAAYLADSLGFDVWPDAPSVAAAFPSLQCPVKVSFTIFTMFRIHVTDKELKTKTKTRTNHSHGNKAFALYSHFIICNDSLLFLACTHSMLHLFSSSTLSVHVACAMGMAIDMPACP